MNASASTSRLAAILSALTGTLALATVATVAAVLTSSPALARGGDVAPPLDPAAETVIYTSSAYTRAIPGAPNPAPETVSPEGGVVYVSPAHGPAIYSYPGRAGSGR
jgi:hypothetical protein